ncbi:hypothetical protein [Saccharomonospora sp. CUA-673]|uniref:hypothetical protein n=1 Tax=Saccharomonospora sp. CUA-673 TaxID=1904969 RepID=UPI0011153975|nr:hypothetical protein [Saccharomonospora sp. CUA-673]
MLFAPVLQDVAARMAGVVPTSGDPVQQAYRLRDAVELVRPDWVVTHHDPDAEAAAARSAGSEVELVDVTLAGRPPVSGLVEVVRILTKLFPDTIVAASLTGPAALAASLATDDGDADLLDCGDVLAELVSAYVGAGARRIIVWETDVPDENATEVARSHVSIVRRLEMLGVPGVLCGGPVVDSTGYAAHALGVDGRGALLAPGSAFARGAVECVGELWQRWTATDVEPPRLVLTDGPVPGDCDLGLLSSVSGRRTQGIRP